MSGFELSQVTLHRPTAEGSRVVLDAIDLVIDAPVTVVTGPSGGGKSTLLRMLNGLLSPDSGSITFRGRPLAEWSPETLRTTVGLVAQQPPPIAETGWAETELAAELAGTKYDRDRTLADAVALDLDANLLAQHPGELSVGERQRLAIVRALAAEPEVLVLDEPTSAQDGPRAERVHGLLAAKVQAGLTLVIVEHRMEAVALHPDRALVELMDGRVSSS